jgi:hypothetical protein
MVPTLTVLAYYQGINRIPNTLGHYQCSSVPLFLNPSNEELASLPHIIMISDVAWDPSIYNNKVVDISKFYDDTEVIIDYGKFFQYRTYSIETISTSIFKLVSF